MTLLAKVWIPCSKLALIETLPPEPSSGLAIEESETMRRDEDVVVSDCDGNLGVDCPAIRYYPVIEVPFPHLFLGPSES